MTAASRLAASVIAGLVMAAASPAVAATQRFAIVIGNNDTPSGTTELTALRYADDDAVRWARVLGRANATVELLTVPDTATVRRYPVNTARSRPPTRLNLLAAVETTRQGVARARARGDTTVVYITYSGHGAHDASGAPYLTLVGSQLTRRMLFRDVVTPLGADFVHVVVDACYAAAVVGVRGPGVDIDASTRPLSAQELTRIDGADALRTLPHVGITVATSANQEAHEWSRYESGVFTHEVLSALSGAADVNGDGAVEYTEVQAYIAAANRGLQDPRAVPTIIARAPRARPSEPLIRLDQLRKSAFLVGTPGQLRAFHIELASGQRLLDAHLTPTLRTRIAIPASTRAWLRTRTAEVEIGPLAAGHAVDLGRVRLRRRSSAGRGAIDEALLAGLFTTPYGRAYYHGFVDSGGLVGVRFDVRPLPRPPTVVEVPEPPSRDQWPRRLIGVAALATAGAAASAVLAYDAKRDFDGTTIQADANAARRRYQAFGWTAVGCGVVALVSAAAGWATWRRPGPSLAVDESGPARRVSVRWTTRW